MQQNKYLVAFIKNGVDPAEFLRRTTSEPWATLQVHQPRKLLVVITHGARLNRSNQTPDTSREQPQRVLIGLGVIERDIKEQLGHTKPP